MPLANELGIVVELPRDGEPGTIELERDEIVVLFTDDQISTDFTHECAGPFEVGALVRVWAVKLPVHPTYRATDIESIVEPLQGIELLFAMVRGDTSLACRKAILDPAGHAAREQLDSYMEESWAEYQPVDYEEEMSSTYPWLFYWIPASPSTTPS